MDIKQLQYFLAIVESDCNLSETSKKIHISQPALSHMIKSFERNENVILFERSHGRLEKLSPVGESFYNSAKNIIDQYNEMLQQLREESTKLKGRIKIGIPPLVISTVLSEVINQLIIDNPDIKIEIIEVGAYELRKKLILQEIDIAILLTPTTLNPDNFEEIILVEDNLYAFMDENNPLASEEKLSWQQLHQNPFAIFDDSFMIHHQLIKEFKYQKINPNIIITSAYWDYLLRSTMGTSVITILPSTIADFFLPPQVVQRAIKNPIRWQVVIIRPKKRVYTRIEEYIFKSILAFFK